MTEIDAEFGVPDADEAEGNQPAEAPKPLKEKASKSRSATGNSAKEIGKKRPPAGRAVSPRGDAPLPQTVSTKDLAEILGITVAYVRQVSDKGFYPRGERGLWNLKAAVSGYIRFLKSEDRQSSKSASHSRVQDVRSREIELRIEEREKRHLVEAQSEAISVIDEFGGKAKSELMALAAKLTTDLALRKKFTDGIDAAFGAAAEAALAEADLLAPTGGPLGALRQPAARPVGGTEPDLSAKRRRSGAA